MRSPALVTMLLRSDRPSRLAGALAAIGGVALATAVVYMLSLVAVFGILPSDQLANSTEPFSAAANAIFGGTWAGDVMAVLIIVSGIGALNGWTMICAEMPLAAARDGLFPERFQRISKAGVPAFGILASTTLGSIAMLVNYLGSSGASACTTLVLMSGITAAIPYGRTASYRDVATTRKALGIEKKSLEQLTFDEARALLAPVYGWFTEGFDTADLQEARALLEGLG